MNELPTNLPDLLNTKIAKKLYDDAVSPAAKEVGAVAVDLIKTVRLVFTAPIQLAAAYQDRLQGFCERVRNHVPPERHVEAPANVAGPVLESLRYAEDGSLSQELLFNLMTKAIDKDHQHEAHPAYPKIIAELSTTEAMLLYDLAQKQIISEKIDREAIEPTEDALRKHFPQFSHLTKDELYECIDHFQALGLLNQSEERVPRDIEHRWNVYVGLNHFGQKFVRVCLPSKERVESLRAKGGAGR